MASHLQYSLSFKIDIDNDEWRILYQIKYFDKLLGLVLELFLPKHVFICLEDHLNKLDTIQILELDREYIQLRTC